MNLLNSINHKMNDILYELHYRETFTHDKPLIEIFDFETFYYDKFFEGIDPLVTDIKNSKLVIGSSVTKTKTKILSFVANFGELMLDFF